MKTSARAGDLATLLSAAPKELRYLSLDCFDTLLWRNVQAPRDVFADLQIPGGGIGPRTWAEGRARRLAKFSGGRSEVPIEEIYRKLLPAASDVELALAVADELAAETRHCYGFAPVLDLIRDAKARGLGVILVSDTYLSEPQLRQLIEQTAGPETAAAIDRIFCSSEYGLSKGEGLFGPVIQALDVPASAILHVGDNLDADQTAPHRLGVNTVHFQQFDPASEQRLRLEASVAALIDAQTRTTAPPFQPHRPQVSLRTTDDPVWTLGHDVMGPLMHAFAVWLRAEADSMSMRLGKPVKLLFLLRDGRLPKRVFEALNGDDVWSREVEISRFTACRASLTDESAIRAYLALSGDHGRTEVLARQLLLSDAEARNLVKGRSGSVGQAAFNEAVLAPAITKKIIARSANFADRLVTHLQRSGGVEPGDAVMLVDLGYNGTVQNLIEPILRDRLQLTVAGRYLLLREEEQTGLDKRGLFDVRHYDSKMLHALSGCIAVIEQMCTVAHGSVADYGVEGEPVRNDADLKQAQNNARDRIQEACIAFAGNARGGVVRAAASDDADARRRMAAAILSRVLFMPQSAEVAVFETFDHDVNLGTSDLVRLLDTQASTEGLRRRGLSYLNGASRMYLPGEVQRHGLPLTMSLFSSSRFDLGFRNSDFNTGALKIPVIVVDEQSQTIVEVDAHPTHDGYYLATIAVGAARFFVGVQLGALCEWVQIEEAAFHPVATFSLKPGKGLRANLVAENMEEHSPGLFRCDASALLMATPPVGTGSDEQLLALVFRPLIRREAAAIREAA